MVRLIGIRRVLHCVAVFAMFVSAGAAQAATHPFVLWTAQDVAAARQRVATQPWARDEYQREVLAAAKDDLLAALFRYRVMGDTAVGEAEKKNLLAALEGKPRINVDFALRYDTLYDLLTPQERQRCETAMRAQVDSAIENISRQQLNRYNWLPNLGYAWFIEAHVVALATGDEALIRKIFTSKYGLQWYFDEYLSDSGFYNEELGKMYNSPTGMLIWCRGCQHLGLDDIGFGYTGKGGASMRGHIESIVRLGYPRIDLDSVRPRYPMATMGDAKGGKAKGANGYFTQHNLVNGYSTDGRGGGDITSSRVMAMGKGSWFELAYSRWPDAEFGYFLAQMRAPDEDRYYPTLYFGLDPIDPAAVKPPAAPSGVYGQRGVVMLRADESPAYWEGAAPAVAMRLSTPYAHWVADSFSLLGFYAFNRPLYVNRAISTNYTGVDPWWSNSARSHSDVIVDALEPATVGEVPTRSHFSPLAKFAAGRAKGVYPDVDQTRALVLTREYLFDLFALSSPRPRQYHWQVQAMGHTVPDHPGQWAPSHSLTSLLPDVANERSWTGNGEWAVTNWQTSAGADPRFSGMGEQFFKRRIGVRVTMLGAPGTTGFTAWTPTVPDAKGQWMGHERFNYGADEPAGALIAAERRAKATTFVALHEPFSTTYKVSSFLPMLNTTPGVTAAAVIGLPGTGINDRIMVRVGDACDEPAQVRGTGELFRFAGYAFVRIGAERVEVAGTLLGMRLPVGNARPTLLVNGKPAQVTYANGALEFGNTEPVDGLAVVPVAAQPGAIAARWKPETPACLPLGGTRTAILRLRNCTTKAVTMPVRLRGPQGLRIEPDTINLTNFAPGAEQEVTVQFSAAPDTANRLMAVDITTDANAPAEVDNPPFRVAHGMVMEKNLTWPADPEVTIYGPRYIARYRYMESDAASVLIDPQGMRRFGSAGNTYPMIARKQQDARGMERWVNERIIRFPYFHPMLTRAGGAEPGMLYDSGAHAHGTKAPMQYWFAEDWIVAHDKDAQPGEQIMLNWFPDGDQSYERINAGVDLTIAEQQMPGKLLVAAPDGKISDLGSPTGFASRAQMPKDGTPVLALFRRVAGYQYGEALFYPAGSVAARDGVVQPGDQPMGFTFCTEEEFPVLVDKWRRNPPSGDPLPEDLKNYGQAYMPKLEKPLP